MSFTPSLTEHLANLVSGDTYPVERDVPGMPEDDPLSVAWLTIKAGEEDEDIDAIVQKRIDAYGETGVGQITDDGLNSAGTGHLQFELTPTDTAKLLPGFRYVYDIRIQTAAGVIATIAKGHITPIGPITRELQ